MSSTHDNAGSPEFIWEPWLLHAAQAPLQPAVTQWNRNGAGQIWHWGELVAAAKSLASRLAQEGVEPGAVCATILRHDPRFVSTYMAIVMAGGVPAVLAYPNARLHPEKFRQGLAGMLDKCGFDWILTEASLLETLGPIASLAGTGFRGVLLPYEWSIESEADWQPVAVDPEVPALLQHSSGTTGLQKPVMLSHRAVLTHLSRYAEAIALTPQDRVVSWLPLYHDMGLIAAFHLPLRFRVPIVQLDPFEWVKAPLTMLEAASATTATLAWLPNFAYNLMAQRAEPEELQGICLHTIRMLINCSEPVRAASHAVFVDRFRDCGFNERALGAAYAMAETTFSLTQTRPGRAARVVAARREELAAGQFCPAGGREEERLCVSSGELLSDCAVRIVASDGTDCADGTIGEVWCTSRSLFSGFRNNVEATQAALVDGWYRTGDLAFLLDGELFVTGRLKDLIIVAGKNLYPEDIEDAVSRVGGVVPGRVAAFGLENQQLGTDEVCVVAETAAAEAAHRDSRTAILKAGMGLDISIARVVLVPPRSLFKSSSGKICRATNKERLLEGMLGLPARGTVDTADQNVRA
jgi:fatty-acyl-CoA synthase